MRINYFQDPGHGWIGVPLSLLADWEIKPSGYSYRDDATGYLEEDCDAGLFVRAAQARGVAVDFVEIHASRDSFIRSLPRFGGKAK